MEIELIKCHGSGNDFLLIDELTKDISFTEEERSRLAVSLCSRTGELGADGILFVLKSTRADARMRVFNADGSEASMCGNGLRCVARYVYETLGIEEMVIETMKANLKAAKTEDIYPGIATFSVEISPVSFDPADLPLAVEARSVIDEKLPGLSEELSFTALAVPNPHTVSIVSWEQIDSNLQETIASSVNRPNPLFPDGVNVSFVKPLAPGEIYVRTFERGVGFTNACGTAMSASSLVTCLLGMNQPETEITVYNNGGKVKCAVHYGDGRETSIDLIGNGSYVYKAAIDWKDGNSWSLLSKDSFEQETAKYAEFEQQVRTYLQEKRGE